MEIFTVIRLLNSGPAYTLRLFPAALITKNIIDSVKCARIEEVGGVADVLRPFVCNSPFNEVPGRQALKETVAVLKLLKILHKTIHSLTEKLLIGKVTSLVYIVVSLDDIPKRPLRNVSVAILVLLLGRITHWEHALRVASVILK